VLDVDRLEAEAGATLELTDVLLLSESGRATVGTPTVPDARVVAEVVEHGRDKKILVFKYKNKTRYRRRRGHRQDYTRLAIKQIGIGVLEAPKAKPKRASRKKAEPADDAIAAPQLTAEAAEVKAEAKQATPRRARKPAAEGAAQPAGAPGARKTVPKAATPTDEPGAEE
jgi:large subunit ribosomal protein L21